MTKPIVRVCPGVHDLPPISAIRQLVNEEYHLVLQVQPPPSSPDFDAHSLIDQLAPQLPDCTVFDNGRGVTIKKVIAEEVVLAVSDAITAAAVLFRSTAADLMDRLSGTLAIPLESFWGLEYRPLLRRGWFRDKWKGRLDSRWRYGFHGYECGFRDGHTGQEVEVILGFRGEFGVLDPYFFGRFVASTPGLEGVACLFKDDFHDPRRALEVHWSDRVASRGLLTRRLGEKGWSRSGHDGSAPTDAATGRWTSMRHARIRGHGGRSAVIHRWRHERVRLRPSLVPVPARTAGDDRRRPAREPGPNPAGRWRVRGVAGGFRRGVAAKRKSSCEFGSRQADDRARITGQQPWPKGRPMSASDVGNSEVSILNRMLRPETPMISPEAARDILAWDFDQADKDRMRQLSARARAGTLTAQEDAEAGRYELLGHLLNIIQSKARRSLKGHGGENGKNRPRMH